MENNYLEPIELITKPNHARKIYLLLGYRCNEQCVFCGLGEDKEIIWPLYKEKMYEANEIKEKIDGLIANGLGSNDAIEFSGGEPTIHRDVLDILSYTRNSFDGTIFLFSNGVKFASQSFSEKYISCGVDNTVVTLHSHKPEVFDEISGLKGSFKKTTIGLKHLHDAGHPISIKFIVNRLNYKHAKGWAEYVVEHYPYARIMINGLALWGQAMRNKKDISVKHSETAPYIEKAVDVLTNAGVGVGIYFMPACNFDPWYWQFFGYRHYLESVLEAQSSSNETKSISYENCYNMPSACNHCVMQPRCVWAWGPYSKEYGLSELNPVDLPPYNRTMC